MTYGWAAAAAVHLGGHHAGDRVGERGRAVLVQGPGDVPLGDDALDGAAVGGDDERADPAGGEHRERVADAGPRRDGGDVGTLAAQQLADVHGGPPLAPDPAPGAWTLVRSVRPPRPVINASPPFSRRSRR